METENYFNFQKSNSENVFASQTLLLCVNVLKRVSSINIATFCSLKMCNRTAVLNLVKLH